MVKFCIWTVLVTLSFSARPRKNRYSEFSLIKYYCKYVFYVEDLQSGELNSSSRSESTQFQEDLMCLFDCAPQ